MAARRSAFDVITDYFLPTIEALGIPLGEAARFSRQHGSRFFISAGACAIMASALLAPALGPIGGTGSSHRWQNRSVAT